MKFIEPQVYNHKAISFYYTKDTTLALDVFQVQDLWDRTTTPLAMSPNGIVPGWFQTKLNDQLT